MFHDLPETGYGRQWQHQGRLRLVRMYKMAGALQIGPGNYLQGWKNGRYPGMVDNEIVQALFQFYEAKLTESVNNSLSVPIMQLLFIPGGSLCFPLQERHSIFLLYCLS